LKKTFQETQSVDISFDKPVDGSLIEKSDGVDRVEKMGDKWKLHTNNPDRLIKSLVKLAQDRDLKIESLEICRASLEDVFLKLTEGR